MELRHIRYFLVVAEEGNITRSAAKLGMAQPPLSQQIKDLESEVGTQLFHRVAHGVELTEAGRSFRDIAKSIPGQLERARSAALSASRGEMGSLQVGFSGSAVFSALVPAAIRAFRGKYPGVALTLEELNSAELIKGLLGHELDVAFMRAGSQQVDGLQMRIVSEETLLAVLPKGHPAAASEKVGLETLREDHFILFPRAIGPLFDAAIAACRRAGFEPKLGQTALHIGSIVNLVSAELGVSLVPTSMRQLQIDGVVFRELAGDVAPLKLAIAQRRGDMSVAVRNFVALTLAIEGS